MKKIAVLARSFSTGGAQRVTANLCSALVKSGYEVDAICLYEMKFDYPLDCKVNIIDKTTSGNRFFRLFRRLLSILSIFTSNEYSAVVDLVPCYRYFNVIKRFAKIPYITSERMFPDKCYSAKQKRSVQLAYNDAALVIFQTNEQAKCFDLEAIGQYAIIPNAVLDWLPIAPQAASPVVISAARMNPQKNLPLLVEAFSRMRAEVPDAHLIIVGASTDYDQEAGRVLESIDNLNLSQHVTLLDFSSDVHSLIAASMMFVSSSEYEGIQNSLLEALTMGVPCIATDCLGGGAREVLCNGEYGHLVPRDSPDALSQAMIDVANHYIEEKHRAEIASAKVRALYSPKRIYGEWIGAISTVIEKFA